MAGPAAGPDSIELGQMGLDWIDNTGAVTGRWCIIQATTAATFTTLTVESPCAINGTPSTNLNGKVLPVGHQIRGRFTAITLTSGSVIAYREL